MDDETPQDLGFLEGHELLQVCVGRFDVVLNFDGDASATISGPFLVSGEEHGDPLPQAAVHLFPLLLAKVTRAVTEDGGHARIEFSTGHTLRLLNDRRRYESYQVIAAAPVDV